MLPFLTQPAVAHSACYVPQAGSEILSSLMFRGAQDLHRTQVAGSRTTFTFAVWAAPNGSYGRLAGAGYQPVAGSTSMRDEIWLGEYVGFLAQGDAPRTRPAARLDGGVHGSGFASLVTSLDTVQPAESDRIAGWLNGEELTSISYPDLNQEMQWGLSGRLATIGCVSDNYPSTIQGYFSGLVAEVYIVDGAALPARVFGEYNIHGVWVPKPKAEIYAAIATAGGFGPNGCHLDFSDPLDPGKDVSGQGNHWTATGFDAAGADTVNCTPSMVMPTFNPLYPATNVSISEGGRRASGINGAANSITAQCSLFAPVVGKIKAEFTYVTASSGVYPLSISYADSQGVSLGFWMNGSVYRETGQDGSVSAFSVGEVISFSYDGETGDIVCERKQTNGTITTLFELNSGPGAIVYFSAGVTGNSSTRLNTGQSAWEIPAAEGFGPYSTDALAEPAVHDPADGFACETATGDQILAVLDAATAHWGGARYVEIVKRRDAEENWRWRFSDDPGYAIASNTPDAKAAAPALTEEGAYVGYRLRAGTAYGVFSTEVEHETGTATTVTHELATSRNVVIAKMVSGDGGDWYGWHPNLDDGYLFLLNDTVAPAANSAITGFDSNSFQIGADAPSGTYRIIVLAERLGFLSFTSYSGTGSASYGQFIPFGMLPLFSVTIPAATTGNRYLNDAARTGYNPTVPLLLESTAMEGSGGNADLVFGGIKLKNADSSQNASSTRYLAIAIGRPLGGICVAPATAR